MPLLIESEFVLSGEASDTTRRRNNMIDSLQDLAEMSDGVVALTTFKESTVG
jgi:hypothetical protein